METKEEPSTIVNLQSTCISELIERQVSLTPNSIALITDRETLSYQELNHKANQLAGYLRDQGVGDRSLVGICLGRTKELVIALLAVLKTGAAYVPLDPAYPPQRLAYILSDAEISLLLTQKNLAPHTDKLIAIYLDREAEIINDYPTDNLSLTIQPEDLVYVIYTSGSTGNPKGVAIQHDSLVNFLLSMQQQPGITDFDTLLAVTTISFDIAALEIYLPLIVGAELVLASRRAAIDPNLLMQLIVKHRVSILQATPVTWKMLLANQWQGAKNLKILCGGEALSVSLAEQLAPLSGEIWNLYGPTETTIWSTLYKYNPIPLECHTVPIGKAIANTELYVLDSELQPVSPGTPGELYIGGAGLARGYLHRPDLTAERFIPHPFCPEQSKKLLYKTGDRVRYLRDGNLEYLGRSDNQVKIRGFRIELGEIEAVLNQHPTIQTAVVIAREQNLLAYYLPQSPVTDASEISEIRLWLQTKLPSYMIPSTITPLASLPLTPNGKIDRKALN
jgi:amino acid adenylation domain-containing protein